MMWLLLTMALALLLLAGAYCQGRLDGARAALREAGVPQPGEYWCMANGQTSRIEWRRDRYVGYLIEGVAAGTAEVWAFIRTHRRLPDR